MIIVGTAGHIDHGKSSIVKRLTGTDPDRLPEEKARGMTIDLGFAFYATPGGDEIAFVDVPGHERFVKNMIAGAGGIDVVMLVVAADDGWMPQSQEHFQILKLLGVRQGVIIINKIDLVEVDWLALLKQDVQKKVHGSFLESAPILNVSAQTGAGFDRLADYLNQLPSTVRSQRDIGRARLYIDRSFIRPGIGGVVTGTLRGGTLSVGQPVSVWPSSASGKIRSLQSASNTVETAHPGQRTALAVTGVDKELLVRGGVVSSRIDTRYFSDRPVLALALQMLPEARVPLEDRRRVLFMVGTTEVEGEARLFDHEELKSGESGIVFVRPDAPVYAHAGDHFILRLPTPMVTLGGGTILDHVSQFPKRKELPRFEYLRERLSDNLDHWIISELRRDLIVPRATLCEYTDFGPDEVADSVAALSTEVGQFGDYLFHPDTIIAVAREAENAIAIELAGQPHVKGLTVEALSRAINRPAEIVSVLTDYLTQTGTLTRSGELISKTGSGPTLKGVVKEAHDKMMAELTAAPFAPPALETLAGRGKNYQQAIAFMLDSGEVHKCGGDFLFLTAIWHEVVEFVRGRLEQHNQLTVADLKEKFGFSRKWAIPILEETDRIGLSARRGDIRVKGERFDA